MRALLIINYIPEESKWYLFEDASDGLVNSLRKLHGVCINAGDADEDLETEAVELILNIENGVYNSTLLETPAENVELVTLIEYFV